MNSRQLDAGVEASGPHDFAVREKAPSSLAPPASTASRPTSMTLRNAPLSGQDGDEYTTDSISEKQKYFFDWGWTRRNAPAERDLPVGQNQEFHRIG
jgi:hypothetical protein